MPALNEAELAARYGFAVAVLNSDPELKALFKKAVAATWTPERFQAEIRASKWYQTHGEAWRNAVTQKAADPATYASNLEQVKARLGILASELGAVMTGDILTDMAESAYMFGWDDNQLRQSMSTYVEYTDGRLLGQAGQWEDQLREYAAAMGVTISDETILNNVQAAVAGESTISDALGNIKQVAKSAFPHLAERLDAGETVKDIASPYMQSMSSLLEMSPSQVSLQDPTIRQALAYTTQTGPALRTLYDFENDLRKDSRWKKTKNAQDEAMNKTNRVLSDMGLVA